MPESPLEKIVRLSKADDRPGRQVATPGGVKKFGKPIGADIKPGSTGELLSKLLETSTTADEDKLGSFVPPDPDNVGKADLDTSGDDLSKMSPEQWAAYAKKMPVGNFIVSQTANSENTGGFLDRFVKTGPGKWAKVNKDGSLLQMKHTDQQMYMFVKPANPRSRTFARSDAELTSIIAAKAPAGPKPGTKVANIAELKSAPVGTRVTIAGGTVLVKQKNGKWAEPGSKVMSAETGFADKFSLKQGDVKWA